MLNSDKSIMIPFSCRVFQQLDEFTEPGCSEFQPSTAGALEDAIRPTAGKKESTGALAWHPAGRRFGATGLNFAGWGNSSGGVWKSVRADGPSVQEPAALPGCSADTLRLVGSRLSLRGCPLGGALSS